MARDGYREYKSAPKICANGPTRELRTHSKDCVKTVQRHIWKGYEEKAGDARYTPAYAQLCMRRKETIEWIFADAKEKHAMPLYTVQRLGLGDKRGEAQVRCHELKKLATWKWSDHFCLLLFNFSYSEYARNPVAA